MYIIAPTMSTQHLKTRENCWWSQNNHSNNLITRIKYDPSTVHIFTCKSPPPVPSGRAISEEGRLHGLLTCRQLLSSLSPAHTPWMGLNCWSHDFLPHSGQIQYGVPLNEVSVTVASPVPPQSSAVALRVSFNSGKITGECKHSTQLSCTRFGLTKLAKNTFIRKAT